MPENKSAQYDYENKTGARKTEFQENSWENQLVNWRSVVDYEIGKMEFLNARN